MASASVKIDRRALSRLLSDRTGPVARLVLRPGVAKVRRAAKRIVRAEAYDTGELHNSIYGKVVKVGNRLYGEVGATAAHASFIEKGTGIYGPRKQMIIAKPGKVFVFRSRTTGQLVFTRRIRGTRPIHFLERALDAV